MTIAPVQGPTVTYTVTTWLNADKAVALAVARHRSLTGADERRRPYDVQVQAMGRAARDADGAIRPERADLLDRMEW